MKQMYIVENDVYCDFGPNVLAPRTVRNKVVVGVVKENQTDVFTRSAALFLSNPSVFVTTNKINKRRK